MYIKKIIWFFDFGFWVVWPLYYTREIGRFSIITALTKNQPLFQSEEFLFLEILVN